MAEDTEDQGFEPTAPGDVDPAAIALALGSASRAEADAFLKKHGRLADAQIEILHKYEVSHLRWRRFNDWARAGWQVMLVLLGALAVAAVVTALWDASRAEGLVVDAFTVPPDFERQGLSGDVVAGDVVDKLGAIRKIANTVSYSFSNDVSAERANEVKVDIPETGISVSDAWRYLRRWLGHERHLSGSVRELGDGRIALSLSLDGADAMTATGKVSDLPALEQKTAEDVFSAFDPVNYINYLSSTGQRREAMDAAARFTQVSQGLLHADSYNLWGYTTVYATGDVELGLARVHIAMNIYPRLAVAHVMAARLDSFLGHDEDQLVEDRIILTLHNEDQLPAHQHGGFDQMRQQASSQIARLQGDFAHALYWGCSHSCTWSALLVTQSISAARLHDVAVARKRLGEGLAAGETYSTDVYEARFDIDLAEGNWNAATVDARGITYYATLAHMSPRFIDLTHATYTAPMLAVAQARAGRFADAQATIDATPRDCVACDTARGDIDALQKHWAAATAWFASAEKLAPSVPFADTDWGAMLLAKRDFDGAIAKFKLANEKGPHFADPLEMWGEALIAKNRSDLALAKFEEANKYVPNWGRLHLKWGEALLWTGDKTGAARQFAIASQLNFTSPERSEFARMRGLHG